MAAHSSVLAGIIPWTGSLMDYIVHEFTKSWRWLSKHITYTGTYVKGSFIFFTHIYAYMLTQIYTDASVSEWKSLSCVQLFATPWNSPGQNTGMGSFSLPRGSSQPRDGTKVFRIVGGFFTNWAIREAHWVHQRVHSGTLNKLLGQLEYYILKFPPGNIKNQ